MELAKLGDGIFGNNVLKKAGVCPARYGIGKVEMIELAARMLGKVVELPISLMARETETSYILKRKANR
jgi:hypothetical protein